jgi:glutamyl-tRNA reductase
VQRFLVFGLSYKTAPLEIRERFALSQGDLNSLYNKIYKDDDIEALVILCTCNRVEFYCSTTKAEKSQTLLYQALSSLAGTADTESGHFYCHQGRTAVEHLVSVASGLDSMVLGEPQVAGQVKNAYLSALKEGKTDAMMNQVFHRAFQISKKVRTDTDIQRQPVSVPYTAVVLAEQIFGKLHGKNVYLIGAGEMSELAAKHLLERDIGALLVLNRDLAKAERLAERYQVRAVQLDEGLSTLASADIVLSSTAAPEALIPKQLVKEAMQKRKNDPMLFIDIGVPRDVEPAVNELPNVYLFDIDDLQQVVDENLDERKRAACDGAKIISEEVLSFEAEFSSKQDLSPLIKRVTQQSSSLCHIELERLYSNYPEIKGKYDSSVSLSMESLRKKMLHPLLRWLKEAPDEQARSERISIVEDFLVMQPSTQDEVD